MASRFWVGGTATWDGSTTTNWAASSNGAGGQSVPGSSDDVTFDANSGGGTVTVNTTVNVNSITMPAFTGTLDFSANNNNVTLNSAATAFENSGTGTRGLKMGGGTWTLAGSGGTAGPQWHMLTTTNMAVFDAGTSTIVFSGAAIGGGVFSGGTGKTYNNLTVSGVGHLIMSSSCTFATVTIGAGVNVLISNGLTQTITTLAINGSATSPSGIVCASSNATTTISIASNAPTITWTGLAGITGTGGATFAASNSFDWKGNSGITITAPSGGGGASLLVHPSMTGGMRG